MTWVRLDDAFFQNPKARAAGKDGRALAVAALCYCARMSTDGHIPKSEVRLIAAEAEVSNRAVAKVLEAGLWHPPDHECPRCPPVTDGYYAHGYLEFNPSAAEVEEKRAKRSAAGKKGAASKWNGKRHGNSHSNEHGNDDGSQDAPVPLTPSVYKSSSNSRGLSPPEDDDGLEAIWSTYAQRKVSLLLAKPNHSIDDPNAYQRRILRNAPRELGERVAALNAEYQLTATELVDVLLSPSPPTWLNLCRRNGS